MLVVCALAATWAAAVAVSGGFVVQFESVRLSSRQWEPAAALALACALAFRAMSTRAERARLVDAVVRGHWLPAWANATVVIALVAATLLTGLWLRRLPLWLDEEMIAVNLRDRSLGQLGGALWLGQTAPLGWLVVQRLSLLTLGASELALRVVPLLFGIATVAIAAWAGRRWMGAAGAAALAVLVGFGQWLTYHAAELKPYSADACWGLLLPVLATWALDGPDAGARLRRMAVWWLVAAIGLWFANGALLGMPACALVLFILSFRRDGWRGAAWTVGLAMLWLASFGAHYELAIRHTLESSYLRDYWAFAMPPASAGPVERVTWVIGRLESLAQKPGGSRLWLAFWLVAACGFVVGRPRRLGALCATVPLSAFVLAALRVVPLFERLSLWMVPALCVGVALFVDRTVPTAIDAWRRRDRMSILLTAPLALVCLVVVGDIVLVGLTELGYTLRTRDNHQLDDRAGVAWLLQQRRPGDVVMTTHLALPAIWWYAGVPLNAPFAGGNLSDDSPIFEVGHAVRSAECHGNALLDALEERRRVLVYLGFRFDDVPDDFDERLLAELSRFGAILAIRSYGGAGRALVVERVGEASLPVSQAVGLGSSSQGCLTVRPASRW